VTLGALDAQLCLFPTQPFYITEFAYSTQACRAFGWPFVSERTQARHLARADGTRKPSWTANARVSAAAKSAGVYAGRPGRRCRAALGAPVSASGQTLVKRPARRPRRTPRAQ
jgi:hypothetical protein